MNFYMMRKGVEGVERIREGLGSTLPSGHHLQEHFFPEIEAQVRMLTI
jgi:hypothetical protein